MKVCATLAAAAAVSMLAPAARADQTASSTIAQIKVNERSDARHKLFHGAIWLQADKATHHYRWGGKHCNNAELSDTSLQLLYAAFRDEHSVTLDYTTVTYKDHTSRCITGFTVSR